MVSICDRDCTSLIWAELSLSTTSTLDISLFFCWEKGGFVVSAPRLQLELYPHQNRHTHPPPTGGERGSTELLRQRRRAHLLSINVARRYGDHCGLAYEPGQEGADPERGPVDPGTSRGIILRAA